MRAKIYFDTDFLKFLLVFNIQICSVLVILIRASNLFNFKLQETQFRTLVSSLICFMYPDFYKHHHKNEYMGELTARNGWTPLVMFIDNTRLFFCQKNFSPAGHRKKCDAYFLSITYPLRRPKFTSIRP